MYGPTIFQLSHIFDLFCWERVPDCVQKMAANPESHMCVCVGSPSVYMKPSSTFSTCFVLSRKCFANGMTTL
jgi:hypothetical protein